MIEKERRDEIKEVVKLLLQLSDNHTLPVKIKQIARSNKRIRLIPFSQQMELNNLTFEEVVKSVQTMDACTDYLPESKKYIIYYNNITPSIVNSNRFRWNIAHELGHVYLRHLENNSKTRIYRSTLTDYEYNQLEEEADYFASLLLVPYAALLPFKVDQQFIRRLCLISRPATYRRFKEFQIWKLFIQKNDPYDRFVFSHYFSFIYQKRCKSCDVALVQRLGNYCPICGHNQLEWGNGTLKYEKLETHENKKLKVCPICQNEDTNIEGQYCQICRTQLINCCDNREYDENGNYSFDSPPRCGQELETNARFCPKCGSRSTFLNDNILKAWNYKPSTHIGDGFMDIPDGVEDEGLPFN